MDRSDRRWQFVRRLSACLFVMTWVSPVRAQQAQAPRRSQPTQQPQPAKTMPQATEEPAKEINPLAAKQEMIRDRFQRFQDRVFSLREQLSETEPENAARLARALQRAGELVGPAVQLPVGDARAKKDDR